jgi:hypothetical protein
MHRAAATPQPPAEDEEQGMHCHPAKMAQKHSDPGCVARTSCNHSTQIGLLAPIPRAVMAPAISLDAPINSRVSHLIIETQLNPGFIAPPFNPPRLLA